MWKPTSRPLAKYRRLQRTKPTLSPLIARLGKATLQSTLYNQPGKFRNPHTHWPTVRCEGAKHCSAAPNVPVHVAHLQPPTIETKKFEEQKALQIYSRRLSNRGAVFSSTTVVYFDDQASPYSNKVLISRAIMSSPPLSEGLLEIMNFHAE